MNRNRGEMSTGMVVGLGALALIVVVLLTLFVSYVSANNYGANVEASLKAARENNMNILAQYQQKAVEAAQVPEMYKNDFKEVIAASMQGRYGPDGSKATFQWLQEHQINFDSSIYKKLMSLIMGGRKDFELGQTKMIDIKRGYEAQLGYFWRGMWLRNAGYPKIDLNEYKPVITNGVADTFKNNREAAPLKLR